MTAANSHWDLRPLLAISFSGGETSGMMTDHCHQKYGKTHRIETTFANTGCEDERTLAFVDKCDRHFGWNVVWLEAVVSENPRVGIRHRRVDYFTAARNGEPFEAYIRRHGIPGPGQPQCTTRLKEEVMIDYLKRRGFKRGKWLNYDTAIGIRADEMDRMDKDRKAERLIYPLADAGVTLADVKRYWSGMPFRLGLPGAHHGNCKWCWKKSQRKHYTLALEEPEAFDFPRRMEQLYRHTRARNKEGRFFFRGHMTADQIIENARTTEFVPYSDRELPEWDPEWDAEAACGSTCEVGADT